MCDSKLEHTQTHTCTHTRTGLGKTTLAHVVARHCGYHPYEINAHLTHTQTLKYTHTGLGKTTLAHVVARHCGYHPYEINASDDRTATSLTQRVTDAVQMKPVCMYVCVCWNVSVCLCMIGRPSLTQRVTNAVQKKPQS